MLKGYHTREEALEVGAKAVGLDLEGIKKLGPKDYPQCLLPQRDIHFDEIYIIRQGSPFSYPQLCVGLAKTKDVFEPWILYPDIGLALSIPYRRHRGKANVKRDS
jgi:hypothetical protein